MTLFSDITQGVSYVIQSFHEKASGQRTQALKLSALRLKCLEQSLGDCQAFVQAAGSYLQDVAEQLGREIKTMNRVAPPDQPSLKLPVDNWRTLYSAGGSTKKALSYSLNALRTSLFIGELRRLSFNQMLTSAPLAQPGIEMTVIGAANRPVTTVAGTAELSSVAQWVNRLAVTARYFGMFMTAFELFMSARSIAQMQELQDQLEQYARDADKYLQSVHETFAQMVEQMRELYVPLSQQSPDGRDQLVDTHGNTLVLQEHFAQIGGLAERLGEQVRGGSTAEAVSEQRQRMQAVFPELLRQASLAKAILIDQSQSRMREIAVREGQVQTAMRALRGGISSEQVGEIVGLPETLIEQLSAFAQATAATPSLAPELETNADGDWLVRMPDAPATRPASQM